MPFKNFSRSREEDLSKPIFEKSKFEQNLSSKRWIVNEKTESDYDSNDECLSNTNSDKINKINMSDELQSSKEDSDYSS
jgi:hypothetical protein